MDHWPFCASAAWMAVSARLGLAVKKSWRSSGQASSGMAEAP
ncbi:hypothetical protein [Halochromatium glycolicum]|nr:hypothetical protein [Halochromatium glycolicum]